MAVLMYNSSLYNSIFGHLNIWIKLAVVAALTIAVFVALFYIMIKVYNIVQHMLGYSGKQDKAKELILGKYNITTEQFEELKKGLTQLKERLTELEGNQKTLIPAWVQDKNGYYSPYLFKELYEKFGEDIDGWKQHIEKEQADWQRQIEIWRSSGPVNLNGPDEEDERYEREKNEKMEKKRLKMEEERLELERQRAKDTEKIKNELEYQLRKEGRY